jgi:hypothetical protein
MQRPSTTVVMAGEGSSEVSYGFPLIFHDLADYGGGLQIDAASTYFIGAGMCGRVVKYGYMSSFPSFQKDSSCNPIPLKSIISALKNGHLRL